MDVEMEQGIKQAKNRKVNFVLIGKGTSAPQLLISRSSRISPERIKEVRAESGGKVVNRGLCFWEEDVVVFQCEKKPPWNLVDHLRKLILREAKMLVRVELRHGKSKPTAGTAEEETEEVETELDEETEEPEPEE